jgi:tetratricopeptide (TPR) repeat protein
MTIQLLFFTIFFYSFSASHTIQHTQAASMLGEIQFPTSGSGVAQNHFITGVAALHSFWYPEALQEFQKSTKADPDFAMGYWGEAMAHNAPLWERQDSKLAKAALSKISDLSKLTQREQHYIQAVQLLYGEGEKTTRDKAYSKAMKRIYTKYPNDLEAACFYSLSLLGIARNTEKNISVKVESGAIALEIYEKEPDHPCAAHYAIHAFDHPDLARLALPSAQRYAKIAPASHHAQHMPAHIFIQLGMWSEAAKSNENGWATSQKWVERNQLSKSNRDYHSLQWLHYVYSQQGLLRKAETIFKIQQKDMLEGIQAAAKSKPNPNLRSGKYYYRMFAATILETEEWEKAKQLVPPEGWKPKTFSKAGYNFVRGYAAAMQGNNEAEKHIKKLKAIREKGFRKNHFSRSEYLEVWELEIKTAIKLYEKDYEAAIQLAKKATLIEKQLPSPTGPPRILKPTYELLGEVYLKAGKPKKAKEQFTISLARHPKRIRSLLGAARSAKLDGDQITAKENYLKILSILKNADENFSVLNEAKTFIKNL